jgi:hypothetical protein
MTFGGVNLYYRTGRFHRKVDGLVGFWRLTNGKMEKNKTE